MEATKERFQHLDQRLLPYVQQVFDRLPEVVTRELLTDPAFQLVANEDFFSACTVRMNFNHPVHTLVAINPRILREPAHRILLAIAAQIAAHRCSMTTVEAQHPDVATLLNQWGFNPEIEAVHSDEVMAKSEAYQVGYRWARQQHLDYLKQHFGIYADEWSSAHWGNLSDQEARDLQDHPTTTSILEEISRLRPPDYPAISFRTHSTTPLSRRMVLAGIVAAIKEKEMIEHHGTRMCDLVTVS